jgi:hypothetical protein
MQDAGGELRLLGILRTSPLKHSQKFAITEFYEVRPTVGCAGVPHDAHSGATREFLAALLVAAGAASVGELATLRRQVAPLVALRAQR